MIEIYIYPNYAHMCAILVPFYLNHPGGNSLAETIREECYWKVLVVQAEMYAKPGNIC